MTQLLVSLSLLLLLLVGSPASAAFKCVQNGSISYSDQPCPAGTSKALAPPDGVSTDEARRARERAKTQANELARIERAAQREALETQRTEHRLAGTAATKKRSCARLAQQGKWREEDAAHANARSMEKARRNARRAAEKYALECGNA